MIKNFLILASWAFVAVLFSAGNIVHAAEYMTEAQIEEITENLSDAQYVLPTSDGGVIMNMDGSDNFPEIQLASSEYKPMTVPEYKEFLKTFDISRESDLKPSIAFRGAYVPTEVRTLYANQSYLSNPFSASGWRYGELVFVPAWFTGDYLYWQVFGDSGRVDDRKGNSTPIEPGQTLPVYSKSGTYFRTYNPVNGSKYYVSNPV